MVGWRPSTPVLVLALLPCCCGEEPSSPPRYPEGTLVVCQGVPVPARLVDPFLPYLQTFRPNEAPEALKRYILEGHAIPMARALASFGKEYEQGKAQARQWLTQLEAGKLDIGELARRQARAHTGKEPGLLVGKTTHEIRSALPIPISQALFQATPGEFVGPLATYLGLHLFRLHALEPGLTRDQDKAFFQEAVLIPGGREHLDRYQDFTTIERGSVTIVDPAYREIVTLSFQAPSEKEEKHD
jgi:hypothetical protein